MPGLLQGGRCKWSSHSCIQALARRHPPPTAWVKLLYHCFCWTPDHSHTAASALPLFLPSFLPSSVLKCAASPMAISFFFTLILSCFSYQSLFFSHTFTHSLLRTLTHSTWKSPNMPLPLSCTPSHLFPIPRAWVLPHPTQRQRKACAPWTAAQSCS